MEITLYHSVKTPVSKTVVKCITVRKYDGENKKSVQESGVNGAEIEYIRLPEEYNQYFKDRSTVLGYADKHGSLNSLPTLVPTLFPAVIYYYKPLIAY